MKQETADTLCQIWDEKSGIPRGEDTPEGRMAFAEKIVRTHNDHPLPIEPFGPLE